MNHVFSLLMICLAIAGISVVDAHAVRAEEVATGIWKVRLGNVEKITPVSLAAENPKTDALKKLPDVSKCPLLPDDISYRTTARGCIIELPLKDGEQIYGLGMRLPQLNITGRRITTAVSDSPDLEDGFGHGPVPLYVTTEGYGVFVDTFRYARFYCGNLVKKSDAAPIPADNNNAIATSTAELYASRGVKHKSMTIEVPSADGVDVYIFAGPTMRHAVQRYNLFAGGGCMPPLWGLGIYYRGYGAYSAKQVIELAKEFRQTHMPCTVFGLEPGWQSKTYSCSFVWSKDRWPDPNAFIAAMKGMGYQLNLWEHAFTHPSSPLYGKLKPYSGDYLVWEGLVPDFTIKEAAAIFGDYHANNLIAKGITGFKLDECDNQPQGSQPWSFPELSKFPSGMDGEQMHSAFGVLYQKTLYEQFKRKNIRTLGQVRASGAMASYLPFVLYSDAYNHRNYVRGILNSGFSGLLWQPEVRVAGSETDLLRRMQTAICSPQALINAWFMPHPPWDQIDENKNKNNELMPNRVETAAKVREILNLRMRLVPYLYTAFMDYYTTGMPPFRALVMDYPTDPCTYNCDDEYMMGPSLLVAPLFDNDATRKVYLPKGTWHCFWTHKTYEGTTSYDINMPPEQIPLFVKDGTLLPLARPVEYIDSHTTFDIDISVYGNKDCTCALYEDDGTSFDFEKGMQNKITLKWSSSEGLSIDREGKYMEKRYSSISRSVK